MRVRLPETLEVYQPGWGGFVGLEGLGQDDSTITDLPVYAPSDVTLPDFTTISLPSTTGPISMPEINPSDLSIPGYTYDPGSGMYFPTSTSVTGGSIPVPSSTAGSGLSLAQLLGSAATAAQTAAAINKTLQSPALIPGTNLVYNPATGQITSGVATTSTAVGSLLASPVTILAIGALLILMMSGK